MDLNIYYSLEVEVDPLMWKFYMTLLCVNLYHWLDSLVGDQTRAHILNQLVKINAWQGYGKFSHERIYSRYRLLSLYIFLLPLLSLSNIYIIFSKTCDYVNYKPRLSTTVTGPGRRESSRPWGKWLVTG